TRPQGEPYPHERHRPIPLYLRGAGVAHGRYHDLVCRALEILNGASSSLLAEACFDPQLLDELALDARAYDHGHPVNRRPNYVFGEWDPHHIDNQGCYRRFVVRQVVLDALLERVAQPGPLPRDEALFEAAALLGNAEPSVQVAAQIPDAIGRLLAELLVRLTTGQLLADRSDPAAAARLLPEVEDLLRRGIACGAFADPWNVLGFQGLFPLFH